MTEINHTSADVDILARTLWGEAERGDRADAIAIAWVVRNRVLLRNWPDTVKAVCLQPWQFSCWNADNPNLRKMQEVSDLDAWFADMLTIAKDVLSGSIEDPTHRSTHYYATYIKAPRWAKGKTPVYETPYGEYNHLFFNDIDTPPPQTAAESKKQVTPPPNMKGLAKIGTYVASVVGGLWAGAEEAGIDIGTAAGIAVCVVLAIIGGVLIWRGVRK